MAVYVDTGAWIALHDRKDSNHGAAKRTAARLKQEGERLVTGRHTLVEFADGLARHYDQHTAAHEVDRISQSPRVMVEESESHWSAAMDLLRTRTDWNVDLSDCLSFALMSHVGITRVLSFDSDFERAGFSILK